MSTRMRHSGVPAPRVCPMIVAVALIEPADVQVISCEWILVESVCFQGSAGGRPAQNI